MGLSLGLGLARRKARDGSDVHLSPPSVLLSWHLVRAASLSRMFWLRTCFFVTGSVSWPPSCSRFLLVVVDFGFGVFFGLGFVFLIFGFGFVSSPAAPSCASSSSSSSSGSSSSRRVDLSNLKSSWQGMVDCTRVGVTRKKLKACTVRLGSRPNRSSGSFAKPSSPGIP